MSLRDALQSFLDHRHVVLLRRTNYRLAKIAHRLEVLAGYLIVFLNLDEVIRIIRFEDDPKGQLIESFSLSELQAEAILNMRLRALRKLEEMELRREHDALLAEQIDLQDLLTDDARQKKVLTQELKELKKAYGKDTPLGARRTEVGDTPMAIEIPLEATVEREPITILLSHKGWVRAMKGHHEDLSDAKYKEGDKGRFVLSAYTTDKLLLLGSGGRIFTLGADRLPGGRGFGEPLRLIVDLPNEQEIVQVLVHRPGGRLILASDDGRGFQLAEQDVLAQKKNGRQVLNLADGAKAMICKPIGAGDDAIAVIGENRRLLVYPLDELPEMGRGRGVMLQRYRDGGLSDIKTFKLEDGLSWSAGPGGRVRTQRDLTEWRGKRAQAGRLPPVGFPRSNKFGEV
jgi:topoisomerase-4 subunit A